MDSDSQRFASVAGECARTSTEALDNVRKFITELNNADNKREGVSLLEVKNRELLAYMADVSFLMGRMSCGQSIAEEPAVIRATKHRTILERIRPIEDKMKTQIDKLAQLEGRESAENGKMLKARPDQMELEDSDESEENEDEGDMEKKTKKYVPPKMMAVHYDEDDDDPKNNKKLEKARRRALQSSLIQELKQQYSDAPVEYREVSQRKHEIDKARERFEEDNLVRLKVTRADRAREARMTRDNAIDDLLNFGNYMMRGEDGEAISTKRKKGGGGPPGKKSKTHKFEKKKLRDVKQKNKMAGQYEAELCCAIVEERFGISASQVAAVILREPSHLPGIILNLKGQVTSLVIKKSIALLEQFNIVKFNVEKDSTSKILYFVDVEAVIALLKAPRCGMLIQKLFGASQGPQPAIDIFLRIFSCGRLSCSETIKRVVKHGESVGEEVDAQKVAELFRQIAEAHYLIRCRQVEYSQHRCPVFQPSGDLFAFPEKMSTEDTAEIRGLNKKRKHAEPSPDAETYWRINFNRFDRYFCDELITEIIVPKNWTGDEKSSTICKNTLLAFLKCMATSSDDVTDRRNWFPISSKPISASCIIKSSKDHSIGVDEADIKWALRVLVEDSRGVIRKVGDTGGGLYELEFYLAICHSCQQHLECLMKEQLDTKAVRVFRLLQAKGHLEEEHIEKLTMMSAKETRELLFAMQEEGYVFTKPIGRTQDFAPARTFYLYYIDLTKIVRGLVESTCKSLRNIILRRKKEVMDHKYLVDKNTKMEFIIDEIRDAEDKDEETKEAEIADVKETYMPAADMSKYEKFLEARSMLDKAEVDTERVLMIFRLYLLLSKSRNSGESSSKKKSAAKPI